MKYMLNLIGQEGDMGDVTPEEMRQGIDGWNQFNRELIDAGVFVAGEPLEGSETATTLRVQGPGEQIVTDGPFAETKEQIGGFYLLECADLDEAISWARKVPVRSGGIEIRPVRDLEPFGYVTATELLARVGGAS